MAVANVCAGPPGTEGYCSGECCSAADGTCAQDYDSGGQVCCAPRTSIGLFRLYARELLYIVDVENEICPSCGLCGIAFVRGVGCGAHGRCFVKIVLLCDSFFGVRL